MQHSLQTSTDSLMSMEIELNMLKEVKASDDAVKVVAVIPASWVFINVIFRTIQNGKPQNLKSLHHLLSMKIQHVCPHRMRMLTRQDCRSPHAHQYSSLLMLAAFARAANSKK